MKKLLALLLLIAIISILGCDAPKQDSGNRFRDLSAEVYCASYRFSERDGANEEAFDEEIRALIEKYDYTEEEAYGLVEEHQYDIEFQKTVLGRVRTSCPEAVPSFEDRISQLEQEGAGGTLESRYCIPAGQGGDSARTNFKCCPGLEKTPMYIIGPDLGCQQDPYRPEGFYCIICGDGVCRSGESTCNCHEDCGYMCGDSVCDPGETATNCPSDCEDP